MALKKGVYRINNVSNENTFVGTGPLPRALRPSPLRGCEEYWASRFLVEPQGGDNYKLLLLGMLQWKITHKGGNLVIDPFRDAESMAIDQADVEGVYRIHVPNKDLYWTLPNHAERMAPITLSGDNGSSGQEWKFEWINEAD
ncbi:hypothetical protein RSOLAG1IB_08704 [Rhizoctonia solani AG-1 IB]|uniref:Ricin B lectin domain-containing protein n=1 Tax=Thanatephorus cucumeris (strain AG1-IB / isolate 7/3/14) TaxID=1108050 RepID=A0A0B7FL15_THACB|nr:hypothetical protein RSOLAG1IB_08704 [Rhizoctonia solani AG-1 IB]